MWFAYLYRLAQRFDVSFSSLIWVRRSEQGEITGRAHFHALVSVPGRESSQNLNRTMMWLWGHKNSDSPEWGGVAKASSRVYSYNPRLSGAEYITKALGVSAQSVEGSLYELSKFDAAQLTLSDSFRRWLGVQADDIYDRPTSRCGAEATGNPPEAQRRNHRLVDLIPEPVLG